MPGGQESRTFAVDAQPTPRSGSVVALAGLCVPDGHARRVVS